MVVWSYSRYGEHLRDTVLDAISEMRQLNKAERIALLEDLQAVIEQELIDKL